MPLRRKSRPSNLALARPASGVRAIPRRSKALIPMPRFMPIPGKWLNKGWVDYFAPQLYWDIDPPAQSYPVLLKWWAGQNVFHRHLWPGNAISRLGRNRPAIEIVNQIYRTRQQPGATGNILWDCRPLMENRVNIVEALRKEPYANPP